MSKGLFFWILMLLWIVSYATIYWRYPQQPQPPYPWVSDLLLFVLLFLLGWAVFGFIVQ